MPSTSRTTMLSTSPKVAGPTRRSTRLRNQKGLSNNVIVEIERAETLELSDEPQGRCNEAQSSTNLHASALLTPLELNKRQKALLKQERELKRRSDQLDDHLSRISKKEAETTSLLRELEGRKAEATLALLEEHFTCSLCYDIIACPYTLTPSTCGHSFCAGCTLKWFFSRLHRGCGGWHESVDCPICRSLLSITPDRIPRSEITFPFTPNRTMDTLLKDLVYKLAGEHALEDLRGRGKKLSPSVKIEEGEPEGGVAAWKDGGALRTDWLQRDRDGRDEMNSLIANWANLRAPDFIMLKARLGV